MRIDLQIPAHLDKEVAADLFLSILEGSEFSSEIQTTMASLSLVGHEFAGDLLPPGEPTEPALEFRTLHDAMVGQFCPSVKRGPGAWRFWGTRPEVACPVGQNPVRNPRSSVTSNIALTG